MGKRFEVVPFEADHYLVATATLGGPVAAWRNVEREAEQHLAAGPAFTGFVDGFLAGCAGIHCLVPGRGEAWAILTPTGRAHPIFVTRTVVRYMRAIIEKQALLRVEADVVARFGLGCLWVERMGFELEATKRKYCEGVDFAGYVYLPPGKDGV